MYKYGWAMFEIIMEPNIPRGSRVMSIFTNWPRSDGLMLWKASFIKKAVTHASDSTMLTRIRMQHLVWFKSYMFEHFH